MEKKRRVVFQERDSALPVGIEPPFQSAQEKSDEISFMDFDTAEGEASVGISGTESALEKEEEVSGVLLNGWRCVVNASLLKKRSMTETSIG